MALVPVDIIVKSGSVGISDATVHVYDEDGQFVSGVDTDIDGKAALLIEGDASPGIEYEVRIHKFGYRFGGPKRIVILDPLGAGESNIFDVDGTDYYNYPSSNQSGLCRLSGVLVDMRGHPIRNGLIRIAAHADVCLKVMKVWNKAFVVSDAIEVRTDDNGRVSVDLMSGGEYWVTFIGESDVAWPIKVPDAGFAADFSDVLHLYPFGLSWDDTTAPSHAVSVAVGERKEVLWKVMMSDFRFVTTGMLVWFKFVNSDETKILVEADYNSGKVWVTGVAAGSAEVQPTMLADDKLPLPRRYPSPSGAFNQSFPLLVTVTA